MNRRQLLKIGLAFTVIFAVGIILALSRQQARSKPPQINVRFVGLTNDAAGIKFARFEVRNDENYRIQVWLPGFVDLGQRGGGYWFQSNVTLYSGAVREAWIEAPTNRLQWRAEFLYAAPLNWMSQTRNLAHRLGVPVVPVGQSSYHACSDLVFDFSNLAQPSMFTTNGIPQSAW